MRIYIDGFKNRTVGLVVVGVTNRGLRYIGLGPSAIGHVVHSVPKGESFALARDHRRTGPIVSQLKEYFEGKRKKFRTKLDLSGLPSFTQKVLRKTFTIPYGKVVSYAQLARAIGRASAYRAVGQVMARNRLAIVVPCHRVIASGGQLGGFQGKPELKIRLLRLEGLSNKKLANSYLERW